MSKPRYRSIILDVDSTLSRIEGIDWLAALRGREVLARISEVTERAMRGELLFEGVYAARLDTVRPTSDEIRRLGDEYIKEIAPGAKEAISRMMSQDIHFVMVSGGLKQALLPLAEYVGIQDVHAVPIYFDEDGEYAGFDEHHPCARQQGKRNIATELKLEPPVLAVGDGITDAELKPVVDAFCAFTGVTQRAEVIRHADFQIKTFDELANKVLQ
jgi:phosphoserine phosphatase